MSAAAALLPLDLDLAVAVAGADRLRLLEAGVELDAEEEEEEAEEAEAVGAEALALDAVAGLVAGTWPAASLAAEVVSREDSLPVRRCAGSFWIRNSEYRLVRSNNCFNLTTHQLVSVRLLRVQRTSASRAIGPDKLLLGQGGGRIAGIHDGYNVVSAGQSGRGSSGHL